VWDQQAVIPQATSSVTLDGLFAASLGKPARRLDKLEKPTGRLEGLGKMGRLEGVGKPAGRLEGLGKRGPYKQGQGSTTDFTSQKSKRVTGGAGSNEEKIRQVVEVVEIDSGSGSETNQSRSDAEAEAQVEADDSQIIADRYNARKRMEASKADPTPDPHPRTPPQPSSKPSIPISNLQAEEIRAREAEAKDQANLSRIQSRSRELAAEKEAHEALAALRGGKVRLRQQPVLSHISGDTVRQDWIWYCKDGHSFTISREQLAAGKWCAKCERIKKEQLEVADAAAEQERMFNAAKARHKAQMASERAHREKPPPWTWRPAGASAPPGGESSVPSAVFSQRPVFSCRKSEAPRIPAGANYSQEQAQFVHEINETPDGFIPSVLEHLELAGSSHQEIQKRFRQLAAKLHPDKNKAPGSANAFARLKAACDLLCATGA